MDGGVCLLKLERKGTNFVTVRPISPFAKWIICDKRFVFIMTPLFAAPHSRTCTSISTRWRVEIIKNTQITSVAFVFSNSLSLSHSRGVSTIICMSITGVLQLNIYHLNEESTGRVAPLFLPLLRLNYFDCEWMYGRVFVYLPLI